MARYAVELRRTASTSQSLGTVTADATRPRRGELYYLSVGSEATPADNAFLGRVRRVTAAGTSTAVTPVAIDFGGPTCEQDAGENHTAEPTYTANSELLVFPFNQKATFQWSQPPNRGLVWPGTGANGLGIDTPTASAVVIAAMLHFED